MTTTPGSMVRFPSLARLAVVSTMYGLPDVVHVTLPCRAVLGTCVSASAGRATVRVSATTRTNSLTMRNARKYGPPFLVSVESILAVRPTCWLLDVYCCSGRDDCERATLPEVITLSPLTVKASELRNGMLGVRERFGRVRRCVRGDELGGGTLPTGGYVRIE